MTPIEFFYRSCKAHPGAIAVESGSGTVTYADLCAEVQSLAAALQSLNSQAGSRVGICAGNTTEHTIAWLAALAAGKVWIPLYPKTGQAELQRITEFTETDIVLTEEAYAHFFKGSNIKTILLADHAGAGTSGELRRRYAGKTPAAATRAPDAPQAIKFTGGSTGTPKGVMQPIRAWTTNILTQIEFWNMAPGERTLIAAPMTHGTSTYILPTLGSGGTLVIADRPRPEDVLDLLANKAITTVFLPPTVIYMMMTVPDAEGRRFPALRNLIYGAGPMRTEAIQRAQHVFEGKLASTYGQTEAPQIATAITSEELQQPELHGSVGRATKLARVEIMDDEGNILAPGSVGEIVFKGDLVMTGYWKQPEKTAETLIDGWLHTGDLGTIDDQGYLFIKGRNKDVIISGGFNVYPADVEHILGQHPAVRDCAVFGTPDEKWGEAVRCAVEFHDDQSASETDILSFVKEQLGGVRTPKSVAVYETLPRNDYGKLQKQTLIDDATRSPETAKATS